MPELAEVEFCRRLWDAGLDREITRVALHPKSRVFRDAKPVTLRKALTGAVLKHSLTHGKRMFFTLRSGSRETSGPLYLEVHLGMTGRLTAASPDHSPTRHHHLVLFQDRAALVFDDYRQFGRVVLHRDTGEAPWAKLPPQPQEKAFTAKRLKEVLAKHPKQPIKAFLLDQEAFPGVGNWMADEILWRAAIHPATPVADCDPAALLKELRFVCRGALHHVADKPLEHPSRKLAHHTEPPSWGSPPASWLFQHRWENDGICPRCRTVLIREKLRARTACYCPACQVN